jgi:hypothetical protein
MFADLQQLRYSIRCVNVLQVIVIANIIANIIVVMIDGLTSFEWVKSCKKNPQRSKYIPSHVMWKYFAAIAPSDAVYNITFRSDAPCNFSGLLAIT